MSSRFTTVPKTNLHVQVARTIARSIVSGDLAQGSIIPREMILCQQFGISRTALREAIKLLTSKGLLRSKPKIGTTVLGKSNWNHLEPEACALAAKNATVEQGYEDSGYALMLQRRAGFRTNLLIDTFYA